MNSNIRYYIFSLVFACFFCLQPYAFSQARETESRYEGRVMISFENSLPPVLGTVHGVRCCENQIFLGGVLKTGAFNKYGRHQWASKIGFYPAWYIGIFEKREVYFALPVSFFHYRDDVDYPIHPHRSTYPFRGGVSVTPEIGLVRKLRGGNALFLSINFVMNWTLYDSYKNNDLIQVYSAPERGLGLSVGFMF